MSSATSTITTTSAGRLSQLRADAEFLQSSSALLSTVVATTTNWSAPTQQQQQHPSNSNSVTAVSIATLQATNKFNLEVADLLQSPPLYPWRKGRKSSSSLSKTNSSSNSSSSSSSDDEILMQQWWKYVQEYIQLHITDSLRDMPVARWMEGSCGDRDGVGVLQVVPMTSKEYPPLGIFCWDKDDAIVPTIPVTVLLPISTMTTIVNKNDYKNERYFQVSSNPTKSPANSGASVSVLIYISSVQWMLDGADSLKTHCFFIWSSYNIT
jgi:hypothetical protein